MQKAGGSFARNSLPFFQNLSGNSVSMTIKQLLQLPGLTMWLNQVTMAAEQFTSFLFSVCATLLHVDFEVCVRVVGALYPF